MHDITTFSINQNERFVNIQMQKKTHVKKMFTWVFFCACKLQVGTHILGQFGFYMNQPFGNILGIFISRLVLIEIA